MGYLMLKHLPRYESLLDAAKNFPYLDPSATEAYLHLLRTGDDLLHICEAYMAEHNLTQGRFVVLIQLLNKEENCPQARTPAELADMCGVTRATMTGLIDTLERDGLVKRELDKVDRRMMSVHLTERGHGVLRQALPGHCKNMARIMSPLSEAERKTLVRLLSKILKQAEAPQPGSAIPA
jgi:DNA-binding MarR family transcriptional regulator